MERWSDVAAMALNQCISRAQNANESPTQWPPEGPRRVSAEGRRRRAYVVVEADDGGFIGDHGMATEEAVEEDAGGGEGELGELEHDANLSDEVDAFAAVFALLLGSETVED